MRKRYGKLLSDGVLEYAPKRLLFEHRWYINPSPATLKRAGYKELVFGEYPSEYGENQDVMELYNETETTIEITYEVYDINPEEIED